MRRLAAALLLIAGIASAQSLQTPGVPSCNQWGFCPAFTTPFVDAGVQTSGQVAADHIGGNGAKPTCRLDAGFTSCVVNGNDVAGTVILNAGTPSSTANTLLFSLIPAVAPPNGFTCIVTGANNDAGIGANFIMTNTNNGTCNVGLASTITFGWGGATGSAFSYVFGRH